MTEGPLSDLVNLRTANRAVLGDNLLGGVTSDLVLRLLGLDAHENLLVHENLSLQQIFGLLLVVVTFVLVGVRSLMMGVKLWLGLADAAPAAHASWVVPWVLHRSMLDVVVHMVMVDQVVLWVVFKLLRSLVF